MNQINKVKVRSVDGETRYVCDCGSMLVELEDALSHDQYARIAIDRPERTKGTPVPAGRLDESQPLSCKWAGARFEIPTADLKQIQA